MSDYPFVCQLVYKVSVICPAPGLALAPLCYGYWLSASHPLDHELFDGLSQDLLPFTSIVKAQQIFIGGNYNGCSTTFPTGYMFVTTPELDH